MPGILANRAAAVLFVVGLTTGCTPTGESNIPFTAPSRFAPAFGPSEATAGNVAGFLGGAVADEPLAALAARNILASGGNAADAAVGGAMTLTVTYPSRAGLGGGGVCLAFAPKRPAGPGPEAILFPAGTPASPGGADRPAGVPMMARGLYLLSARYGRIPFESLVTPAEQLARSGITASRAFVQDLRVVAGPLAGDPIAASIFLPGGQPLAEGQGFVQPDLAATLAQIRVSGVGDFYQGNNAHLLAEGASAAGGGLTVADLRASLPTVAAPIAFAVNSTDTAYFAPTDGGVATGVAFRTLRANSANTETARALALGAATRLRRDGGDPVAAFNATSQPASTITMLPASTSIATLDREGGAVVCNFTMNNLFGTGRIAGRTGVLLAASPRFLPPALLSAGMVVNQNLKAFRALAGASGQDAAPVAAATALLNAANGPQAMPVPVAEPGRANAISCPRYLPGNEAACNWATDPRGAGVAVGSN
jgi:gamma-glutamyltranspeptidase/glutathione hydrolase